MTVKTGEQILAADVYPLVKGGIPGGRLTLATGDPDTLADQTDKMAVYYTPFVSDMISLFDGTDWDVFTFSELSLGDMYISGLTQNMPYDIFIYNNSGTLTLESKKWTNTTTRATALTRQNGVLVKSDAATRRYLGTVFVGSYLQDSETYRYVWNMYNRVMKILTVRADGTRTRYFVIGNPAGQYVKFGAGGTFNGTASAMLYLRSTVEPLAVAPFSSEAGNQHADSNKHGISQVEVGLFAAGLSYIGMEKGGTGTIDYGHLWAEIWC